MEGKRRAAALLDKFLASTPPQTQTRLSYLEKENAVIGYLTAIGFAGVDEPLRTRPDSFTHPLCSVVYEAALYLHRMGKTANQINIVEAIEGDRMLSRIAKDAATADGLADWQTFLAIADASLSFNPAGGQIVSEYLADITEAAGRRKAAEIGRRLAGAR